MSKAWKIKTYCCYGFKHEEQLIQTLSYDPSSRIEPGFFLIIMQDVLDTPIYLALIIMYTGAIVFSGSFHSVCLHITLQNCVTAFYHQYFLRVYNF